MKQLLDTKGAAEYLGLHPQTLADWRYRGIGPPYVKLGARRVRYRLQDIDAWLEQSTKEATA